jgi:4-diphosphocytidyl-2-C-methyl-D-erythritol kinase
VARHPQIGGLVERLQAAGARLAGMSGSGSAVFGLFDEPESVERARRSAASAGVRCLETATLARVAYRNALGLAVRVGDRSPL